MINIKSVTKYCCEDPSLIENYTEAIADTTQMWDCHHRRGTIYSKIGLIEIGEYYDRPAIELIFMPATEHTALHNKLCKTGKYLSEDHLKKLSAASSGENNPMYGRSCTDFMTPDKIVEWRSNISKATSGTNNPFYGRHHSKKTLAKFSKPVLQYTKDLKFVREWASSSEAAKAVGSCKIGDVCNGHRQYAGGFIWVFKDDVCYFF